MNDRKRQTWSPAAPAGSGESPSRQPAEGGRPPAPREPAEGGRPPEDGRATDAIVGRAFRWSLVVFAGVAALVLVVVLVLKRPAPEPEIKETTFVPPVVTVPEVAAAPIQFTDVTRDAGIDFVHVNGATGDKLLPETMGGGCAFLDYDGDGDQDLLLVNSDEWSEQRSEGRPHPTAALYRNDGAGRFDNVTAAVGLDISLYGMGVAVGDYDNDGDPDVFLTAVGPNRMLRNDDGRFVDVTKDAGVAGADDEWSTSTGFLDYDNDGDLDLFVCNYVRWSRDIDFELDYRFAGVGRAYGPPANYRGTFPYLYRNEGDGTFTDVSETAGLHVTNPATGQPVGKALGVAMTDVDNDGWIDLLVANDTVQNELFHNRRDGTFEERGVEYGVAYDRNGAASGAMGIDAAHFRNDDALGFVIGNFANEMSSLYVSQGVATLFADESIVEGIGGPTRLSLTFGSFFFDYDLDGRLDLFQTNGHLEEQINVVQPSQHYEQPAQLFWNRGAGAGGGCFVLVKTEDTGDLARPIVGRGAAYADIDNDGDLDVLITQVARPPLLLRNDLDSPNRALRVRLVGQQCNRDAIGAWVEATAGDLHQRRPVMPTRSYISQVELPVTIGLGEAHSAEVVVHWPGGKSEPLGTLDAGFTYAVTEGRGVTERGPHCQTNSPLRE